MAKKGKGGSSAKTQQQRKAKQSAQSSPPVNANRLAFYVIPVVLAVVGAAVVSLSELNTSPLAGKVANGNSTDFGFSLNPADYVSSQGKTMSKRIGEEKQAAQVIYGSATVPAGEKEITTLDELNIPFVEYMHDVPLVTDTRAMAAKFRNFKRYRLEKRWDDGSPEGVFSGHIAANGFSSTNTYTTHTFIFIDTRNGQRREVARFEMRDDRHLMVIEPDKDDVKMLSSEAYRRTMEEQAFMKKYYDEKGTPWLAYYPRSKPRLNLWPADRLGQTHKVISNQGFYHCDPTAEGGESCYDPTPVHLDIKVVSTGPRVLVMENLMSEWECEHIRLLGEKVIKRSSVGDSSSAFESDTRTSENGWLSRHTDAVLDSIYRRFADALNVRDEDLMHDVSAENLQVVRYNKGQQYQSHYDFGYSGRPNQRFLTLLLYLEVPEKGGHTSFPKAFGGRGMNVRPPKGSAALFYSMLPDGNADDLSLHAGNPVLSGQKWICNLVSILFTSSIYRCLDMHLLESVLV
jgi:prolyl 4-hydroxylase